MNTRFLFHEKYGDPEDVIQLKEKNIEQLGGNQVLIKMHFAPINPADLNMAEGRYYTQPALPSALGNEGVGEVIEIGSEVSNFQVGNHVILPFKEKSNWIGAWSEYSVAKADDLLKVDTAIPLEQAAMMTINPVTAWQMIHSFTSLNPGDWILQNAANSGVGRWVIHIAKQLGLKTANIVRNETLATDLIAAGADKVFLDQSGVSAELKPLKSKLALNAVGGDSAKELAKGLRDSGILVTYGAMGLAPLTMGNGLLIYKNLQFSGFNRTRWVESEAKKRVRIAYDEVIKLMKESPFSVPVAQIYPLTEYKEAIRHAKQGSRNGKILFKLS